MINKNIISAITVFALVFTHCSSNAQPKNNVAETSTGVVIHLTSNEFKKLVFNYVENKQWKYEGNKPCIVDFYASWCGPCRHMSPIMDEIAKEYAGKLVVYKIDTDAEQQLSQSLGITSLPTFLFVPQTGNPQASVGAVPKESLVKAIHEILLVN